jgi:serine/threonine-protein kinase RsbW
MHVGQALEKVGNDQQVAGAVRDLCRGRACVGEAQPQVGGVVAERVEAHAVGFYSASLRVPSEFGPKAGGPVFNVGMAIVAAPRIQRRVPADAEQVPRLRAAVTAFTRRHCVHSEETRQAVALAVTEACANVVRHAYPDRRGELTLTAWVDEDELTLLVADTGIGLGGATSNAGLGLGFPLMRAVANTRVSRGRRGTQVRLTFPRR